MFLSFMTFSDLAISSCTAQAKYLPKYFPTRQYLISKSYAMHEISAALQCRWDEMGVAAAMIEVTVYA